MNKIKLITLLFCSSLSIALVGCNTMDIANLTATGADKVIHTLTLPIETNEGYSRVLRVPITQEVYLFDGTYAEGFAYKYMELWNKDMQAAGADEEYMFDLGRYRVEHMLESYKRRLERNFMRYNMAIGIRSDAKKYREGNRRGWEKVNMDPRSRADKPSPRNENDDEEWEWRG